MLPARLSTKLKESNQSRRIYCEVRERPEQYERFDRINGIEWQAPDRQTELRGLARSDHEWFHICRERQRDRDRELSLFNRKREAENQHEPNRFRNMKEELDMN
jgi:hypothetical protein